MTMLFVVWLLTFVAIAVNGQDQCDFSLNHLQDDSILYNAHVSQLVNPQGNTDASPNEFPVYWKDTVLGINSNRTIFMMGGYYNYDNGISAHRWVYKLHFDDSYMATDASTSLISDRRAQFTQSDNASLSWEWLGVYTPDPALPDYYVTSPLGYIDWTGAGTQTFFCESVCSVSLGDVLYVVSPRVVSVDQGATIAGVNKYSINGAHWPILLKFDMREDVQDWIAFDSYNNTLPNNVYRNVSCFEVEDDSCGEYDEIRTTGAGCTVDNTTHIFHFNYKVVLPNRDFHPATFMYDIESDAWLLRAPNPSLKIEFGCARNHNGTFIYLFAGANYVDVEEFNSSISYATLRYNTHTDEWSELPFASDFPEAYGRVYPRAVTDDSANRVLIVGGYFWEQQDGYAISRFYPNEVQVFNLADETWTVPQTDRDVISFGATITDRPSLLKVANFSSDVSDESADLFLVFNGVDDATHAVVASRVFSSHIQFLSSQTIPTAYSDAYIIEAQRPTDADIETSAFDPYGRLEMAFRIVVTDPDYLIDVNSWNFTFEIDGDDLGLVNAQIAQYNKKVVTRDACQCDRDPDTPDCEWYPDNVLQVTVVQMLVPSFRTLNNGYCVDRTQQWIFGEQNPTKTPTTFSPTNEPTHEPTKGPTPFNWIYPSQAPSQRPTGTASPTAPTQSPTDPSEQPTPAPTRSPTWLFLPSIISLHANNETMSVDPRHFEFNFLDIDYEEKRDLGRLRIMRGCEVTNSSNSIFSTFTIRCDGYRCDQCPIYYRLGGGDLSRSLADDSTFLKNWVRFNVLMDDVLLSPGEYINQHQVDRSIVGTQALQSSKLVALVQAFTDAGVWFEKCFYDFFDEDVGAWNTLQQYLQTHTAQELFDQAVTNLYSNNNPDMIAAYSILVEMAENTNLTNITVDDVAEEINAVLSVLSNTTYDSSGGDVTIKDITSDLSIVNLLTSDPKYVDPDVALDIATNYLPDTIETVVDILNMEGKDATPEFAETVQHLGVIADNAATNLVSNSSNYTEADQQALLASVQNIISLQLTEGGAWIGETIYYSRDGVVTLGELIDTNDSDTCSLNNVSIKVPVGNHDNADEDIIACVISETPDDQVLFDLFTHNGTAIFEVNNPCFPFVISMNVPPGLDMDRALAMVANGAYLNVSEALQLPGCSFWDERADVWDTRGCFWNPELSDHDTIACSCTHLTTFRAQEQQFHPHPDLLTPEDFRELNGANIAEHPMTWVAMLILAAVLLVACLCVPNNNADKPIIAFEDIIYKEFRDRYLHKHQQWHEIQQIDRWYTKIAHTQSMLDPPPLQDRVNSTEQLSTTATADDMHNNNNNNHHTPAALLFRQKRKRSKYYCLLSYHLCKTYLKNDHTVLSVFQRTDGTNFSTKQRIGLFLLYMYAIMMASAMFYAYSLQRHPFGDLTASALISLMATAPVYVIRSLFQWSKPRVVASTKVLKTHARKKPKTGAGGSNNMEASADSGTQSPKQSPSPMQSPTQSSQKPAAEKNILSVIQGTYTPTLNPNVASGGASAVSHSGDEDGANGANGAGGGVEMQRLSLAIEDQADDQKQEEQRRISSVHWNAVAELKKSARPDMRLVRKCMHYVNNKADPKEKVQLASEIRVILFNYNYPLSHACKRVGWALLVALLIVSVVICTVYGMQFDLRSVHLTEQQQNYDALLANMTAIREENAQFCNLSQALDIQQQVLQHTIADVREKQNALSEQLEAFTDDFFLIPYDSTKWLMNVLSSFLLSVFVWQPLSIYMLTWVKIWAFNNGEVFEASLQNILKMLCCCCSCFACCKKRESENNFKMMLRDKSRSGSPTSQKKMFGAADFGGGTAQVLPDESSVRELSVSTTGLGDDRALDIIGFLCNDELFIDLPEFETSETR